MLSVFIMTALTYTHFKLSIGQITGPSLSHSRNRGLSPIPSLWFGIDKFVKFKNRPFIGRFGVKFCKLEYICIGTLG